MLLKKKFVENFNISPKNIINAIVAKVLWHWFGLVWCTSVGVGKEVVFVCGEEKKGLTNSKWNISYDGVGWGGEGV